MALSKPRWISVPTEALVWPTQLPTFCASRRISLAARPASFRKSVMGSVERTGGLGGDAVGLRDGAAVATAGDDVDRVGVVDGEGLLRLTSMIGGGARSGVAVLGLVRLTNSMGGGVEGVSLLGRLTNSIGAKAGGRRLEEAVLGAASV
ncbi:MAG TPA: hypothetical protein PLM32_08140 [Candidatus Competibacter sp.]|nr:hypothetical protein [Candidatus Competibacter sp.]